MSAIKEITKGQQTQLSELHERFFRQAISIEPADRVRAEQAARRLAEIGGVKVNEIVWVSEPSAAKELLDSAYASLSASLSDSLRDSLSDSLSASLSASLSDSLRDSLSDSLSASLSDSLRDSLSDSLWASLSDSLWASLSASLWDSLWDTGWLAFYVACRDVLGVKYNDHFDELLRLHEEVSASCFAIWIAPGRTILCERPKSVKVKDGNLVGIEWNKGGQQ
jgi:hypothetical protein